MQSIAENFEPGQLDSVLADLIRKEQPPRLQATLRMCEYVLKKGANPNMVAAICGILNHADADVRKTVVFCLVEVCWQGTPAEALPGLTTS